MNFGQQQKTSTVSTQDRALHRSIFPGTPFWSALLAMYLGEVFFSEQWVSVGKVGVHWKNRCDGEFVHILFEFNLESQHCAFPYFSY